MEYTKFEIWRKCWEDYLLGKQDNPSGDYEQQIIASIDRMASLPLGDYGYGDESECTLSSPIFGLRARALAYRTRGSRYYRDSMVCRHILEDLEDFYATTYNTSQAPDCIENWWLFEIGAPLRILDILVLLYEELDDAKAWITKYTDVMLHFRDAYKVSSHGKSETGANLMWKCHIHLLIGILRQEEKWIDWANEQLPTMLTYSHSMQIPGRGTMYEDGFYPDGSFIQHYMFSYTGGYGKNFLSILCGLLFAFRGQECLQLPDESRDFFLRMIYESYLPLLYRGHMMDLCRGREPSRYWCQDDAAGSIILRALLYLCEILPEGEKQKLEARMKEELALPESRQCLFYDFHSSAEYFVTPSLAERLYALDHSDTPASEMPVGHFNFGVMCKPVHRTSRYAFSVSMYSRNIACYEKLMLESNRFWHISDGATYLYTGKGNAYSGDYYAAADMQRLAGTTVERSPKRSEDPYYSWYLPEALNSYGFAGGATLGNAGIAGQQYRGQGNGKERTLEVKKSWFMFEKEIVCMGSGISSVTDNPVETIVLNDRLLEGKKAFELMNADGVLTLKEGEECVVHTDRLYIRQISEKEGNPDDTPDGNGYLFPNGAELHLLLEKRTGSWNSCKLNPDHYSENTYLMAWFSHGRHPEMENYAYVILPACSVEEWEKAAEKPAISIVENSAQAHSVRNQREGLLGINFWQEAGYESAGIECSTQASILRTEDDRKLLAVADPTKSNRVITLKLTHKLPDKLTNNSIEEKIEFTLDTKGMNGGTIIRNL